MVSFEEYKAILEQLTFDVDQASDALKRVCGEANGGLTPDSIKSTDEFKFAKYKYEKAAKALRDFNKIYAKIYSKRVLQEKRAKVLV